MTQEVLDVLEATLVFLIGFVIGVNTGAYLQFLLN